MAWDVRGVGMLQRGQCHPQGGEFVRTAPLKRNEAVLRVGLRSGLGGGDGFAAFIRNRVVVRVHGVAEEQVAFVLNSVCLAILARSLCDIAVVRSAVAVAIGFTFVRNAV